MSSFDTANNGQDRLTTLPTFDLSYGVDDEDDPDHVTIFDERQRVITHWISIDVAYAVDLEDIA